MITMPTIAGSGHVRLELDDICLFINASVSGDHGKVRITRHYLKTPFALSALEIWMDQTS
jgi:hypothetical protein